MTLSSQLGISVVATDDNTVELSRLVDYLNLNRGKTFSEGEGADQVDMVFHDTRPLADGANETINLHDGTLTNKVGISITMDKLKMLYIKNNSADADLIIGAAGVNAIALFGTPATETLNLPPKGEFVFLCPDANGVDISVNADLKLEHDGTGSDPLNYDIVAYGVDVA